MTPMMLMLHCAYLPVAQIKLVTLGVFQSTSDDRIRRVYPSQVEESQLNVEPTSMPFMQESHS